MTTDRGVSTLPKENRDVLASAYAAYQSSLRSSDEVRLRKAQRVARLFIAARNAGWPNAVIGEACNITGTSAARIVARFGKDDDGKPLNPPRTPKFPPYSGTPTSRPRLNSLGKRQVRVLSDEERFDLAKLAALARTCTGSRALNHPSRIASIEFSRKIMDYHDEGVTWAVLAEASGMKISGVRMRATRHGYNRGAPPSIAPYMNVVRKTHHVEGADQKTEPSKAKATKTTAKAPKKATARKVTKRASVTKTTSSPTGKAKSA